MRKLNGGNENDDKYICVIKSSISISKGKSLVINYR